MERAAQERAKNTKVKIGYQCIINDEQKLKWALAA